MICAPLEARGRTLGVLYLQSSEAPRAFSQEDLELVAAVALQLALALEVFDAERRNSASFINVLRTLVTLTECAGGHTRGHAQRVCFYAAAIAAELELGVPDRTTVEMTALLHDIARLTEKTRPTAMVIDKEQVQEARIDRAVQGAKIWISMDGAEEVAAAIRAVYEREGGGGGPDGLSGDDIPLPARVVAVALAFDRLTEDEAAALPVAGGQGVTPSHSAGELSAEEGVARLKGPEHRGEFDPSVLDALLRAHRSGKLMPPW